MESNSEILNISDDDVMIIDDDSDENSNQSENSVPKDRTRSDSSDHGPSACKNPLHEKWGNNDTDYKWPSQVPTKIQYIFRLLGYERRPGTRCKFCATCIGTANNLSEDEIRELEKKNTGHPASEQIKIELEKLDKLDLSEEEKSQQAKQLRMLAFVNPGKFMEDFDPERSAREMKKMNRRINKEKNKRKNELYTEHGILIANSRDLCDCLDADCPGCHFPCPKCTSEKCGSDCRNNRRWIYESIEIEGTGRTLTWPLT